MKSDIKIQFVCGQEIVTDLRGENFVGKEDGDHHRTIAEIPNASDELVQLVLNEAPAINASAEAQWALIEALGIPKSQVLQGMSVLMGENVTGAEYAAVQIRVYDHD